MKMPKDTICFICGKPIKTDENYEVSKEKRGKNIYFHKKCYENLKKKG